MTITKYLLEILILFQELKLDLYKNDDIKVLERLNHIDREISKLIKYCKKILNIKEVDLND